MKKVTIDESVQTEINGANEPIELVDEDGHVVGYGISVEEFEQFRKLQQEHDKLYQWANALFNDEDLDKASQSTEEYSLEEVLRHLESL